MNLAITVTVVLFDSAFVHGYNTRITHQIGPTVVYWIEKLPKTALTKIFSGNQGIGYLTTIFYIGAIIGCFSIRSIADWFGRRGGLLISTFLGVFGSLLCGYSNFFESNTLLVIGLLISGVKTGINSVLASMYIWEISPTELRSNIASLYGGIASLGHLTATEIGFALNGTKYWPLCYSLNVIPPIILLMFFPQSPESPRFLFVQKNKVKQVKTAVVWLTGRVYTEEEMSDLRVEYYQNKQLEPLSLKDFTRRIMVREAVIVCLLFLLGHQLCGIKVMMSYLNYHTNHNASLLFDTGLPSRYAIKPEYEYMGHMEQSIMLTVMVITSAISSIITGDKYSIRNLCAIGFFTSAICIVTITVLWHVEIPYRKETIFACLLIYSAAYKIGVGTHAWYIPSEYFNTVNSPLAYTISYCINWTTRVILTLYSQPLTANFGDCITFHLCLVNLGLAYFVYVKVPHGRTRSLKKLYHEMYRIRAT